MRYFSQKGSVLPAGIVMLFLVAAACGTPWRASSKNGSADAVTVEVRWKNDADIDLELWKPLPDGGETKVADCADLPGAGPDRVTGGKTGETYRFLPPYDSGVFLVGVSFWAPGPSKETKADVELLVRRRGRLVKRLRKRLDDDKADLWFPVQVDLPSGKIRVVDRLTYQGL
ncbi:MAG: hypothetical protein D6679_02580 [Candidatus Hydrogenedentota bacterium]|nr:MAG: hypothetical protein D6679_02580 [Candidatus Hydrogenedentota bacterium]